MGSSTIGYIPSPEAEPHLKEIIVDIPEEIKPALHESCCIYKVPRHVRNLKNGEPYTPRLISIGPFHHTRRILKPMHTQKQRYFLAFWERGKHKKALAKYKTFLKENTKTIQNFYSEMDINIKDNQFVDMIMLDAVFILELFLRKYEKKEDYLFTTAWISKSIQRDLLLLENQLPIYVLEQLHRRVFRDDNSPSFLELAFKFFENFNPHRSNKRQNEEMLKNCITCNHFTDLIRYFYLPKEVFDKGWEPSAHFSNINVEDKWVLKTATKLNEAGVSFEKVNHKSLLEIKFEKVQVLSWFLCLGCLPCFNFVKSKLKMPQFKVHQNKECVLRNLIALEQCHYSDQPFICNYISLIDDLINTQEDVEFLVDKEIIVHDLGSHAELANMINSMCKNVVVTCNYYGNTSKKLKLHYNNHWKYYMGMLKSVYFRDPWRISSTVVGVIIFLFAIINFIRVIGLYDPKH